MRLNSFCAADRLLVMLLATDVLFIIIHYLHTSTGLFKDPAWSIDQDRGYSEVFQYVKQFWIVLMLFYLAAKIKFLYLIWCLPFGFLLLDDSFHFHEKLGRRAVDRFSLEPMLGLRPNDFGELMVFMFYGLITTISFIASYCLGGMRDKTFSNYLVASLAGLAFFGVFIDMVDMVIGNPIFRVIEDGGEMIVVSVIAWFIFRNTGDSLLDHPQSYT